MLVQHYYTSVEMALKWFSNNMLHLYPTCNFVLHIMSKYLAYNCGTVLSKRTCAAYFRWESLPPHIMDPLSVRQTVPIRQDLLQPHIRTRSHLRVWGYYLAPIKFGVIIKALRTSSLIRELFKSTYFWLSRKPS